MYNSFYLLYVENQKNYKEQKRKKEAPYLLNKTPTTNWFLYLSYSIWSISLNKTKPLHHSITTTALPISMNYRPTI